MGDTAPENNKKRGYRVEEKVNSELLARLDERTKAIQTTVDKFNSDFKAYNDTLSRKIESVEIRISERVDELEERLNDEYVTHESFAPVQKIVYGLVFVILSTVVLAVLALVIVKPAGG